MNGEGRMARPLRLPACGERVGVRGNLRGAVAVGLAESPPHPESALRANSGLSPHAGRGEGPPPGRERE
ncbi:hypothetical protein B5V03_05615 [Bradyrhizobium betae]|uniref:Uncharacterized protein n=1 Tax=Bradyrhizobium betae TaxID=244734 RepID=A0A4Q1VGL7_9BRAD|nr:hypothetical protein B5V03_05615 [Bradyrhizobium betae]